MSTFLDNWDHLWAGGGGHRMSTVLSRKFEFLVQFDCSSLHFCMNLVAIWEHWFLEGGPVQVLRRLLSCGFKAWKKEQSQKRSSWEGEAQHLRWACLGSQGGGSSSFPVDEEVPSLLGSRSLGLGDLVVRSCQAWFTLCYLTWSIVVWLYWSIVGWLYWWYSEGLGAQLLNRPPGPPG